MPYNKLYSMRKGKQIKQFKLDMSKQKVYVYIWIYRKLLRKNFENVLYTEIFGEMNKLSVCKKERKNNKRENSTILNIFHIYHNA